MSEFREFLSWWTHQIRCRSRATLVAASMIGAFLIALASGLVLFFLAPFVTAGAGVCWVLEKCLAFITGPDDDEDDEDDEDEDDDDEDDDDEDDEENRYTVADFTGYRPTI